MDFYFTSAPEPDKISKEEGRKLFASETNFLLGVVAMTMLPDDDRLEICFAGRSNVGKSTLINALTGRKALARTSKTPGRTKEINFFELTKKYYLVDLPGYGYATAPRLVVERWQKLLRQYLSGRQSLRRAFVLIDSRHGIKKVDKQILSLLDNSAVTFQIVLTKADKIKKEHHRKAIDQVSEALQPHPAAFPEILLTSSEKGWGIPTLRSTIAGLARI